MCYVFAKLLMLVTVQVVGASIQDNEFIRILLDLQHRSLG